MEPIVQSVRQRGDEAVKELTQKFDGVALDTVCTPIAVRPSGSLPTRCSRKGGRRWHPRGLASNCGSTVGAARDGSGCSLPVCWKTFCNR